MLTAVTEKTWGECFRPGRGKCEDWSWEVTFMDDSAVIDHCVYKTEQFAAHAVECYESGNFEIGEYGEVIIPDIE